MLYWTLLLQLYGNNPYQMLGYCLLNVRSLLSCFIWWCQTLEVTRCQKENLEDWGMVCEVSIIFVLQVQCLMAHGSIWTSTFSTVCPSWVVWLANAESETMQAEFWEALWHKANIGVEGWTIFQIRLSVWQPELMNSPENTDLNDQKNKCNQ